MVTALEPPSGLLLGIARASVYARKRSVVKNLTLSITPAIRRFAWQGMPGAMMAVLGGKSEDAVVECRRPPAAAAFSLIRALAAVVFELPVRVYGAKRNPLQTKIDFPGG
jgi:hypothetical protein